MEPGLNGMIADNPLNTLVTVYTSHKESSLDAIGRLGELKEKAYGLIDAQGIVILSTCNRFEVYLDNPRDVAPLVELIESMGGEPRLITGPEAALRLFRIAAGLESQIIGEHEILGQIRRALNEARSQGRVTRLLDTVFRSAIMAGRRVRSETGIGEGGAGYPYAAVRLAKTLSGEDLGRVLIIGSGKVSQRILYLICDEASEIVVASRSLSRAEKISSHCRNAKPIELDELIGAYNVVFIAVTGYRPDLTRIKAGAIIDLSIPPVTVKASGVYHLEDLRDVLRESIQYRARWIPKAEEIISEELKNLIHKLLEAQVSTAAKTILEYGERLLDQFPVNGDRRILERYMRSLLHPLLVSLRRASREASSFDDFVRILVEEYGGGT